jgi:hypothetical protein
MTIEVGTSGEMDLWAHQSFCVRSLTESMFHANTGSSF